MGSTVLNTVYGRTAGWRAELQDIQNHVSVHRPRLR